MDDIDRIESRLERIAEAKEKKEDLQIFAGANTNVYEKRIKRGFEKVWLDLKWKIVSEEDSFIVLLWPFNSPPVLPQRPVT